MASKKVIVVFGATGAQGGSVVQSILSDPKLKESWAVRGVTRDVTKPSAKKLESLGAETVAANLNDVESLKAALKGAYAVFAVTNFWENQSAEVEKKQGTAIADAAKEAGVQHFIWSSLLNITELSKGALPKRHSFLPGFYMSNIPASAPVPLLATVEDTGKFVKGILLNREKVLGKRIYGATKYYTLTEILNEFKEQFPVAGEGAENVELPHDDVYKGILVWLFTEVILFGVKSINLGGQLDNMEGVYCEESCSCRVDVRV
ncbi:hypothetical protein DID88_002832 [Monilinia fructigena]|uniref:NmrA-like domain-containing protein n=1 Tax=Monilinia fructigena TaxID=38457 RepID=A0A395IQ91_9HELO|nr:hypothetical protein DID88_002832 [Monilinia fructigena]